MMKTLLEDVQAELDSAEQALGNLNSATCLVIQWIQIHVSLKSIRFWWYGSTRLGIDVTADVSALDRTSWL